MLFSPLALLGLRLALLGGLLLFAEDGIPTLRPLLVVQLSVGVSLSCSVNALAHTASSSFHHDGVCDLLHLANRRFSPM